MLINSILDLTFQEMYGVSEYWYTMNDLLKVGGHYKEQKFIKAASEFCSTDWRVLHERFVYFVFSLFVFIWVFNSYIFVSIICYIKQFAATKYLSLLY